MASDADEPAEDADEPELPNELKFQHGINRRSRGTVQHDIHEWSQHRDGYSDNHYTLAVAAYERWNRGNPANVPFAIVIRVEDLGRTAKVYTEIAEVLAELQVQARARAQ